MAARAESTPAVPAWQRGRVASWLVTTDHKRIGLVYIVSSGVFFAAAGVMALLMRTQLATANAEVVTRESYNELLTVHGSAMVFLFAMPLIAGLGNYLVPLMIGARDMAFPRLNALSLWLYLFSGVVMMLSFLAEGGTAQAGWTAYPPLSSQQAGNGMDLWILSLHLIGVSSLLGAINFIVTIHNLRAPGMTWTRMPLFVWSMDVFAWLLLAVLPTLSAGLTLLLLDRQAGTHFFDPTGGGSPLLWQHAFWFFGHPEVYVLILPAMGIISEVLPVFARQPIFGYKAIAFSSVAIGFFSMLVWAHHMFTVGLPNVLNVFFMLSTMVIAVPTGVKIFSWLGTLWGGSLRFKTPMLFVLGFLATFTIGGISGVFLGSVPVDFQLSDTYYVVAHIHYVLMGGAMFCVFAGLYYWIPKITGRLLNERLGQIHFFLMFVGFNLTFYPMHQLGLEGMPRRTYHYPQSPEWGLLNSIETVGAYLMAVSILFFMFNFLVNVVFQQGRPAGDDPWQGDTLEWATASPPPAYNFARIPAVRSARPLKERVSPH